MINLILSIVGTALAFVWMFILLSDKKRYQTIIDGIDGSEYFLKDIFFIGFRIISWLGIDISSPSLHKKTLRMSELVGAKEAKKMVLVDLAAQISYVMTLAPMGALITVISGESLCLLITLVFSAFLVVYVEYDKNDKLNKRHEEILREFPHTLSQMALLVNAGMPLREALSVCTQKEAGVLGDEMKALSDDMANGIPDYEALNSFADRCGVDSVRKFSNLIIQNIRKGSSELAVALLDLSNEVWRNRVNAVKVEGEKASTKLMLPILIIFAGILIMVAVPMLRGIDLG